MYLEEYIYIYVCVCVCVCVCEGLLRWYINITITILDIIHCPVFYLNLSSTL
jgi:hypothetical protein